jgi:hypothetical protein
MANALEVAYLAALVRLRDSTTRIGRRQELTRLIEKKRANHHGGGDGLPAPNQNLKVRAAW